jgi:hypothetical protein
MRWPAGGSSRSRHLGGIRTKQFKLLGADRQVYLSEFAGTLGGHRQQKIYGRLNCRSALKAIASDRGTYEKRRVFFADELTAIAAGYRPCAVCMPDDYKRWKSGEGGKSLDMHGLDRS